MIKQQEGARNVATSETTQRPRPARKKSGARVVRLQLKDRMGNSRWITGDLSDTSLSGFGLFTRAQLTVGSKLVVRGNLGEERTEFVGPATVKW